MSIRPISQLDRCRGIDIRGFEADHPEVVRRVLWLKQPEIAAARNSSGLAPGVPSNRLEKL